MFERPVEGVDGAEAAACADGRDSEVAILEQALCGVDALGVEMGGRRTAGLTEEHPGELAFAQSHSAGEDGDRQPFGEMRVDPREKLRDVGPGSALASGAR